MYVCNILDLDCLFPFCVSTDQLDHARTEIWRPSICPLTLRSSIISDRDDINGRRASTWLRSKASRSIFFVLLTSDELNLTVVPISEPQHIVSDGIYMYVLLNSHQFDVMQEPKWMRTKLTATLTYPSSLTIGESGAVFSFIKNQSPYEISILKVSCNTWYTMKDGILEQTCRTECGPISRNTIYWWAERQK